MRRGLAAFGLIGVAACAHATVPNDSRADAFNGAVSGVIILPDSGANALSCTQLSVFATTIDEQGTTLRLGRPAVHQGQGRCSYEITDLPPAVPFTIHVEPASGVRCGNGAALAFAAQGQETISLKEDEGRMQDFHSQCSAATSLR